MSEWKDLVDKINSAKLGNKYIEDSLKGLVYRYYNDGDKACDSRNDPYGYATKYFNALNDSLNDSEIDDIMYKPRIKYETKLKILIDYVCDAYGEKSIKELKKSIKESKIMSYKDFQDVCIEESENDIINFHEYKGAYFVILRTEEECERLLRVLRDKYRFEGTCYKIIDPYNPNYKCYEIMCV